MRKLCRAATLALLTGSLAGIGGSQSTTCSRQTNNVAGPTPSGIPTSPGGAAAQTPYIATGTYQVTGCKAQDSDTGEYKTCSNPSVNDSRVPATTGGSAEFVNNFETPCEGN
jgi:hypothetical protein